MTKVFLIGFISFFCLCACSNVQPYQQTDAGVKTTIGGVDIEVQFYSPSIVRVLKSTENFNYEKESLSVIKKPEKTNLTILQEGNILQLKSDSLSLFLNLRTGHISFAKTDGHLLLTEKENSTKFNSVLDRNQPSFQIEQSFLLDNQEPIYGLGQQQEGFMNFRGKTVNLQQINTMIAVPFIQSVKGYGLFWDNYSVTQFTDDEQGTSFSSELGDCIDYYFMYGENMDGTIACMRDLTGHVPLFPLWTWGYWQSKERYASQKETIGTVKQYRDLNIPLDGIIQDWRYWSENNAYWNGIEFKNPEFPDPAQMTVDIHKLNAHTIISVWPSFGPKTEPYAIFKDKGMLLDFESFPQPDSVRVYDAFNPEARDIYWNLMNKYIFSKGFDGWWLDATEPEYSNITESQLDQLTALGSFRKIRNAFPIVSVGGVYNNQRKETDTKRVYILTRSAFAGQQRYAANSWSGDTNGDWETFKKQIPAGLNFSLCAIPYWNSDIGGFWVRNSSSQNADYRELYVRWLQYGAFTPMMRSHGTSTPREIWQFGKKEDWAYDAIEKFIKLRYKLLPYHYSLSWDVTANSGSIMRMLSMDFPEDQSVYDMGSQYMYGKSFLVVPITESFYAKGENAESTIDFSQTQTYPVYLPKGTSWFDFWTNEKISGGQTINRETPINLMPLYVKAGSIIPFGPDVQFATEKKWSELEIYIYPGQDTEFTLYEDENDNYNYEKGFYSTIKMIWNESEQSFTIEDQKGDFPGMLKERTFILNVIGKESKKIQYQGKKLTINFN